jgi:hypothetical protein
MLKFISALVVVVAFPHAAAGQERLCEFCSLSIELNEARADCFLEQFDQRLARLNAGGSPHVKINLDSCSSTENGASKGVVSTLPTRSTLPTNIVFLDRALLFCVKDFVSANRNILYPSYVLSLQSCRP